MELILTVNVILDENTVVKDGSSEVRFLRFHGSAASEYFRGVILPGGVDTQIVSGGKLTLSARYVLEGRDYTGERCRIFIENNGCETTEGLRTKPKIVTDSKALKDVFQGELYGEVRGSDGSVIISIYRT